MLVADEHFDNGCFADAVAFGKGSQKFMGTSGEAKVSCSFVSCHSGIV